MADPHDDLTANPPLGDYMLTPRGLFWCVVRSDGDGTAKTVWAADASKDAAHAKMLKLARAAETTAWESVGKGVSRFIKSFRPNAKG